MPAPLNAIELRLSMPALPAYTPLSGGGCCLRKRQHELVFTVDVSLWLAEMLSFNHTSLTQNRTQRERLLKKYRTNLTDCSRHIVVENETQPQSLLLFCSWDRIQAPMLIFTTDNRAIYMSSSEQQHCETLLSYHLTHQTSPRG